MRDEAKERTEILNQAMRRLRPGQVSAVANQIGVRPQTLFDWMAGARAINPNRLDQVLRAIDAIAATPSRGGRSSAARAARA